MVKELATALREAQRPLVLTGAGVSVASGIAPFRGKDGVWESTVEQMGTHAMFLTDPAAQWSWYLSRFVAHRDAKPNAAHVALVEIERLKAEQGREFRLVTQNVDGLHTAAGSSDVIEVHGKARRVRCSRQGCPSGAPRWTSPFDESAFEAFRLDPRAETIPTCSVCGALLRPHVLWFDEYYSDHREYRFDDAMAWASEADLIVFAGTSFAVYITAAVLDEAALQRIPLWSVDPNLQHHRCRWAQGAAEDVFPAVVAAWGA